MADGFNALGASDWVTSPLPDLGVKDWQKAAPPPPAPPETPPEPVSSGLAGFNKGLGQGLINAAGETIAGVGAGMRSFGTVLRNDAANQDTALRKSLDAINRIDAGEAVAPADIPGNYATFNPEQRANVRKVYQDLVDAGPGGGRSALTAGAFETAGQGFMGGGAAVKKAGEDLYPLTDEEKSRTSVQVAQGLGTVAGYLGAGFVGGLPAIIGAAGLAGGAQHYQKALDAGATPEEAAAAYVLGGAVDGGLMAVPVGRAFGIAMSIPAGLRGEFLKGVVDLVKSAGTLPGAGKAAVEVGKSAATMVTFSQLQTLADNLVTQQTYKPDQAVTEHLGEGMGVQAIIGAALPGVGIAMRGAGNIAGRAGGAVARRLVGNVEGVELGGGTEPPAPGAPAGGPPEPNGPAPVAPNQRVLAAPDIDTAIQAATEATQATSPGAPPAESKPPPAPPTAPIGESTAPRPFGGGIEATENGGYQFRQTDASGTETVHPIDVWNPDAPVAPRTPGATTIAPDTAIAIRDHYAAAGVRTVFYQADTGLPFDGGVDPAHPDTLFISNQPTRSVAQVAGHEFTHVLANTTLPDGTSLGDLLNQQVAAGITPAGQKYAERTFGATAPERGSFPAGPEGAQAHADAVQAHLINELGTDIGGEAPKFQSFIPRVMDAIQARWGDTVAADMLRKMMDGLRTAMDSIRAMFGETGTRSQNWVTNIGEVHDTLAQMYAERFGTPVEREQARLAAVQDKAQRDAFVAPEAKAEPGAGVNPVVNAVSPVDARALAEKAMGAEDAKFRVGPDFDTEGANPREAYQRAMATVPPDMRDGYLVHGIDATRGGTRTEALAGILQDKPDSLTAGPVLPTSEQASTGVAATRTTAPYLLVFKQGQPMSDGPAMVIVNSPDPKIVAQVQAAFPGEPVMSPAWAASVMRGEKALPERTAPPTGRAGVADANRPLPPPTEAASAAQAPAPASRQLPAAPSFRDIQTTAHGRTLQLRRWLDGLAADRAAAAAATPKVKVLEQTEAAILRPVAGDQTALTEAGKTRLEDVRTQIDTAKHPTGDTPEMAKVRGALAETPAGQTAATTKAAIRGPNGDFGNYSRFTPGAMLTSESGRALTPVPTFADPEGSNRAFTAARKKIDRWLINEARTEATAKGDMHLAGILARETVDNFPPASRDVAMDVVFGNDMGPEARHMAAPTNPVANAVSVPSAPASIPNAPETPQARKDAPSELEALDPAKVQVDAARFQFKSETGEAGVSERLQGVTTWDARFVGTALVWRDAEGNDFVADGHQRFALAKRLMEQGHPPIRVNAFVLNASEGVTDAQARTIAAVKNIGEGTGSPLDAAKIMREAASTGVALPPLPPNSVLVRDGRALARLGPDAFGMAINKVVPVNQAAMVGRLVADHAQQSEAMRILSTAKPENARQAEMMIRDMLASGTEETTSQGGLFGAETTASSVTLERAKIVDEAMKQLARDKTTFRTLVSEAERIQGHGANVLDAGANQARLTDDEHVSHLIGSLAAHKGPVSDSLTGVARRLKAGDVTRADAAREFLGAVRSAMGAGVEHGANAGSPEPGAAEGVTSGTPETLSSPKPVAEAKPRDLAALNLPQIVARLVNEIATTKTLPTVADVAYRTGTSEAYARDLLLGDPAVVRAIAEHVTSPAPANPVANQVSVPPAPLDRTQGEAWWKAMTDEQRKLATETAGLKLPFEGAPAAKWEMLSVPARARILADNRATGADAIIPRSLAEKHAMGVADWNANKPAVMHYSWTSSEQAAYTHGRDAARVAKYGPDASTAAGGAAPPAPPETPRPGAAAEPEPPPRPEAAGPNFTIPPEPDLPPGFGANNKTFTAEAAERARATLREKFARLNSGFDPEMLPAGLALGGFYVEGGIRRFAEFSKRMLADLGNGTRPYLAYFYHGVRDYPGFDARGMDDRATVDAAAKRLMETGNGDQRPVSDDARGAGPEGVYGNAPGGDVGRPLAGSEPGGPRDAGSDIGERPEGSVREPTTAVGAGGGGTGEGGVPGVRPEDTGSSGAAGGHPGDVGRPDATVEGKNFVIEPGVVAEERGRMLKARDNIAAIRLVRALTDEGRPATMVEQGQLAKYVGWGGLSGAFPDSVGAYGKDFAKIGPELRTLLTDAEHNAASASTQFAHYTAEHVIRSMWHAVEGMGFKGGSVFEPGMGVGHFLGMAPPDIAANMRYRGIEMDPMTAAIAKLLYPESGVMQQDFTKMALPEKAFDLVIGNPPFADTVITADQKYRPRNFMLHDYFFAKSLDAVRPGGLLAFVTSAGTMNKLDDSARRYLAERAEFVGGVRLPSDAFRQNAGTDVTTDVLFFKRRTNGDIKVTKDETPPWAETVQRNLPSKDGPMKLGNVNRYFSDNPAQVLGREGFFDKLYKDRYAVHSLPGADLPTALREAVDRLPRDVMDEPQTQDQRAALDFASGQTKDGSYYLADDGKLMQYSGGAGQPVASRGSGESGMTQAEQQRVRGLIPMRDALRDVFRHDLSENVEEAADARIRLHAYYDAFVEAFGPINKAEFQYRRPTSVQEESGRAAAREEARSSGQLWQEGSFDPLSADVEKLTKPQLAKQRHAMRDEYARIGRTFDEGSFDPTDMPDVVIEKRPNIKPFSADPENYRLRSIENYNDVTGEASKKPIFTENVLGKMPEPALASANDGVLWSLNHLGRFDLNAVATKLGRDHASVIAELGDSVFRVPGTLDNYQSRDEYLSGDIITKLELARAAAGDDPDIRRNVLALQEAAPKPLDPGRITMTLGMPWIPSAIIGDYVSNVLQLGSPRITHVPGIGMWTLDTKSIRRPEALEGWDRWSVGNAMNAHEMLAAALNGTTPRITRTERDHNNKPVQVFDKVATQQAVDKYDKLRMGFVDWLNKNQPIRDSLADFYNNKLNRDVLRQFDGSYLTTPGVVASWKWRPHQTAVVARIIQAGNTYMAHAVGAGKTSAMIGAGMEMRRLGLVKKPMYVVPNHMLGQFTKEFYEQYPTARIAVADEERFITHRRRQFVANIAVDDLDAVIITHSGFGFLPISDDFQEHIIHEEVELLRESLAQLDKKADRISVKKLENKIAALIQRLSSRGVGKTDQTFTFEETGVDFLFIDEAHEFRKLAYATRQSSIKGIDSDGSDMAWDLYTKTRYLEAQKPGRSLVLASGTPITNTMGELYSLSRFIQPQALASRGLSHFDSWAQTFGTVRSEQEETAAGTYQSVARFNQFVNLYELYKMVGAQMDVVTSKDLEKYVVRPQLAGGKRNFHMAERSAKLDAYQASLGARMEAIAQRKGPPKKGDDIILSVIHDGRYMAIDPRYVLTTDNDPKSKLNVMLANVARIYKESANQEFFDPRDGYKTSLGRGPATQMIFANMGVNPRGPANFSGYRWMKWALVAQGVKPSEIAYIGDAKNSVQRQKLFNDMNAGIVRVLIGSVKKMGTGVNAQKKLLATHNEDPLWYPADDDQRNGRMLRQGNTNPEVQIHDYTTKGTYDSQMWKLMAKKAGFIEQFFRGDPNLRTMEDLGEASYMEQASAMSTTDERLIVVAEMKQDVQLAERREQAYDRDQFEIRNEIKQQDASEGFYREMERVARANIAQRVDTRGPLFRMTVGTQEFSKRSEAAAALDTLSTNTYNVLEKGYERVIGSIGGFPLVLRRTHRDDKAMHLQGAGQGRDASISLSGNDAAGAISSAEIKLRTLEDGLEYAIQKVQEVVRRRELLMEREGVPYEGAGIAARLRRELGAFQKMITDDPTNAQGKRPQQGALQGRSTTLDAEGRMVEEDPLYGREGRQPAQFSPRLDTKDRAFQDWFGDSKVVDAEGKPLVVYHGTNRDFEQFNALAGHQRTDAPGFASFFTDNQDRASSYAKRAGRGANVVPVYLSMANPLEATGRNWFALESPLAGRVWSPRYGQDVQIEKGDEVEINQLAVLAQKQGYDGLIAHGIGDAARASDQGTQTTYVTFKPEQIKSAISNSGAFNPADPRIQFSPKITGTRRESEPYTPDEMRAYANVGRITDAPTFRERLATARKDLGRRTIAAVLDPYIGVKADDPAGYMALRNANTTSGALLQFLTDGTLKFDGAAYAMADRNGGVEHHLIRPLQGEENRFIWWVAANRAERLTAEDRENLWSASDIATLKATNQGTVPFDYTLSNGTTTRSREAIYLDSLKKLDTFNRNTLDLAVQSGLIADEAASVFAANPFYVPFYRDHEGDGRFSGAAISAGFVKQYAFKKLQGGAEKLNHDLWANAIGNWSHMIDASLRNRAAAGVLDVAVTNGAAVERTHQQVTHQMTDAQRAKLVWVMNNGQRQSFEVTDPMLFTAISALDFSGYRNPVMRAMTKFKTMLTMGVTADPRFMLRVFIKDAEQAVAVAPLSANLVGNIVQGLKMSNFNGALANIGRTIVGQDAQRLRLSDEAANAIAGGATMHLGSGHDTGHRKVNVDTMLNNAAATNGFLTQLGKIARATKELSAQAEDVQRLAIYHKLIAEGVPHDQAAFAGRDMEDFTLRGGAAAVRALTQLVPFLNAMMQGLYKVGRSAASADRNIGVAVGKRVAYSATRRVLTVLAATALLGLALDALYADDEDAKKRTDDDRNTNFWFKIGGTQFRIPKGFEIAAAGTIAANGVEAFFGTSEMTGRRFINNVGSILADNLYMNPTPQAVRPVLDLAMNRTSQGGAIVPERLSKLQSQEQYTPQSTLLARGVSSMTSAAARAIAGPQAQSLAPVQIDYLVNAYFGWLGSMTMTVADNAIRAADQGQAMARGVKPNEPVRADKDLWAYLSGGMIASESTAASRYVDMLYTQKAAIDHAFNTYQDLKARQQPEAAREFFAANKDLIGRHDLVGKLAKTEAEIGKDIRVVETSPTLTAAEKHDRIAKYEAVRNRAAESIFGQRHTSP